MYELFEHKADIGIIGKGASWSEAFAEAAKAMFSVMCDLKKVKGEDKTLVEVEAEDQDALLVEFLNELLYLKDSEEMMYSKFDVEIKGKELKCIAWGSPMNAKLGLKTEVKAATYAGLKHWTEKGEKRVQCIVDV